MSVPHIFRPAGRVAHGFTLIETMVVVTLLAILSAIAVPSFRTLLANNRVSSASSELQALLLYARAEAVYQRTGMAVSMDNYHRHWEVFRATKNDNNTSVTVTGDPVREASLPSTMTAMSSGNTLGDAAVYFDAAGKATPNNFQVTLEEASATRKGCLRVSAAGLVRRMSC